MGADGSKSTKREAVNNGSTEAEADDNCYGLEKELNELYSRLFDENDADLEHELQGSLGRFLGALLFARVAELDANLRQAAFVTAVATIANFTAADGLSSHLKALCGEAISKQELEHLLNVCCCESVLMTSDSVDEFREISHYVEHVADACFSGAASRVTPMSHTEVAAWLGMHFPSLPLARVRSYCAAVLCNRRPTRMALEARPGSLGRCAAYLVSSALPSVYRAAATAEEPGSPSDWRSASDYWTVLYDSSNDGLSTNRFESNVFNYKGPTVTMIEMTDGSVYCLALGVEWRHSTGTLGDANTLCLQLSPVYRRHSPVTVRCNLRRGRGAGAHPCGIFVSAAVGTGALLRLDGELSNVRAVTVCGCGPLAEVDRQRRHKQWEQRLVQRNQKVPLPGKWDDNPDRAILEMAGVSAFAHKDHMREHVER